jgi:hypothetical protein
MKTNSKNFELFVSECKKRVDDFGLHGWDITYTHEVLKGGLGECRTRLPEAQATIALGTEWNGYKKITNEDIIIIANHEIGHLVTARLTCIGSCRFVSESELIEASEQISNMLVRFMRKHKVIKF